MNEVKAFIYNLELTWQRNLCQELLEIQELSNSDILGQIKWNNPYFSYNRHALLKWYCAKDWVSIRFYNGVDLADPLSLFEETNNKSMRTIKLLKHSKLNKDAYAELIRSSIILNK